MTRELSTPTRASALVPAVLSPVDQLGEDIAALASRLHAATYELLVLLQRFDMANGWNNGFLSCAHWLHWRTGIDLGAAREKVRVARALPDLPRLSAAMQQGAISYAKVRALTRVATPANEAQLLDVALTATAAQVERVARAWRRCDRMAAAHQADERHLHRGLRTYVDDDGMLVVHGRLTPEQGAVVQRALDAAADQLWRDGREAAAPDTVVAEVSPAQRRADALALLAESALAGGLDRGTTGDRYQVVLHVDVDSASGASAQGVPDLTTPAGVSWPSSSGGTIECGDRVVDVSAETSARLSCDAAVVVMREDGSGSTLDVGRKKRTVPPAIRRALQTRDAGCRFPGCASRRCDAHHVVHWADGGSTRLDNLVLLCRRHHRLLHEGGYTVHFVAGRAFTFVSARGRVIEVAPPAPVWSEPLGPAPLWSEPLGLPPLWSEPLAGTSNAARSWPDRSPVERRTPATWDGTPFDLGYVIDVLRGSESVPTGR